MGRHLPLLACSHRVRAPKALYESCVDRPHSCLVHQGSTGATMTPLIRMCDTATLRRIPGEWVVICRCWPAQTESGLPRYCMRAVGIGQIAVWSIRGRQEPP